MSSDVARCKHCGMPIFFGHLHEANRLVAFDFDPSDHGYAIDYERSNLVRGEIRMDRGYYRRGEINGMGEPLFKQHDCAGLRQAREAKRAQG